MGIMLMTEMLPPGPKGCFPFGNLSEFRQDSLTFYLRCARDFGDIVSYRLGPRLVFQLNHPDLIEKVLVTQNQNFTKSFAYRLLLPVLGQGLLTSSGDFWRRQRRLAQPAFSRARISAHTSMMVACADRLANGWQEGQTRDIHAEMCHLTLDIAARAFFGTEGREQVSEVQHAMEVIQDTFNRRFESLLPLPSWFPTLTNLRTKRALGRLDGIVYRLIQLRRAGGASRDDFLSLLLQARDADDGSRMTDRQVRDEVMTLLLAGHETTALVLAWAFYLLARHPEVEARLLNELENVLGGRSPKADDLACLPYTESVVLETMRLFPPAYAIGRQAIAACSLGGYRVKAGTNVFMVQWSVHRDPRWFTNPQEFVPDRWENGLAQRLPRYAYFPFGGGPRLCIGNSFAMTEAILLLATLAQRFRMILAPGHQVVPWPSITLRPKSGILMRLSSRPTKGALGSSQYLARKC
jgi:cytochrome P450